MTFNHGKGISQKPPIKDGDCLRQSLLQCDEPMTDREGWTIAGFAG